MRKVVIVCLLAACLTANAAEAKKRKTEEKRSYTRHEIIDPQTTRKDEPWLDFKFDIPEKGILLRNSDEIFALANGKTKQLPPGLAKKVARGKRLPPGWQKKLIAGRALPDNIYPYAFRLPDHILYQLPRQPEGTVLVALEGKVVRLYEATKTIIDVFNLKW